MGSNESSKKSEAARIKVLEKILEFVRDDGGAAVLEITLATNEKEARAAGWPSLASQQHSLEKTVQALPVDVARRVKLVPKQ